VKFYSKGYNTNIFLFYFLIFVAIHFFRGLADFFTKLTAFGVDGIIAFFLAIIIRNFKGFFVFIWPIDGG
jgi:hypothetical protein